MATSRTDISSETAAAVPVARPGLWKGLGPGWQLALWLLVTLRVGLELIGLLSIRLQPITVIGGLHTELIIPGPMPWSLLLSIWQRMDALWYQYIAEHGYHAHDLTASFFPLYPALARLVSLPLGGHIVLAELLLTSVAYVVAMALLYQLARLDVGPLPARLSILLLAFFPTAFFFLAPYAESLQLALTLAALWYARQARPWRAGIAGLGATLAHDPGVLLVFPLAFAYLQRREGERVRLGWDALSVALPGLGLIAITAWQEWTLHVNTMTARSAYWTARTVPPWVLLFDGWRYAAQRGDVIEALNLVCLVGFALLAIAVTVRLPLLYSLYVWPYLALIATHESTLVSPLMSVCRFVLLLFPCFLMLALYLARRPWLAGAFLVTSLLLQGLLFSYSVHFGFVA